MKLLQSTDGNYVELTVFMHCRSPKAILISTYGMNPIWVPLSLCEDVGEPILEGERPEVEIVIPEWLAVQKGLV